MPELPEIETIALDLANTLPNQVIKNFTCFWSKVLANTNEKSLLKNINNKKIKQVSRKGKYLLLSLSNSFFLVTHLRMTGQIILNPQNSPKSQYLEWLMTFKSNLELHYNDKRRFGRLWFFENQNKLADFFQNINLGPDPLEKDFTASYLASALKNKSQSLKKFLLDQSNIAGLGNIYTNEILWEAKIHPNTKTDSLKTFQINALYKAIKPILVLAIKKRGTSISDFRDALGVEGEFQHFLCAHNREKKPCPRCKTAIKRIKIIQRSTYYCPKCQK